VINHIVYAYTVGVKDAISVIRGGNVPSLLKNTIGILLTLRMIIMMQNVIFVVEDGN